MGGQLLVYLHIKHNRIGEKVFMDIANFDFFGERRFVVKLQKSVAQSLTAPIERASQSSSSPSPLCRLKKIAVAVSFPALNTEQVAATAYLYSTPRQRRGVSIPQSAVKPNLDHSLNSLSSCTLKHLRISIQLISKGAASGGWSCVFS